MLLDGHRLQVTPSIGIALLPDHGNTPADLLKRADIALYRAKDSGRNTTELFHTTMQKAASERLRLENDLHLALARGEFELYFQPQVDARNGSVVGAEALLRYRTQCLVQVAASAHPNCTHSTLSISASCSLVRFRVAAATAASLPPRLATLASTQKTSASAPAT